MRLLEFPVCVSCTKERAHAATEALPDDATLQGGADNLALLAALGNSRESVKTDQGKPLAEVEMLLPQWREK